MCLSLERGGEGLNVSKADAGIFLLVTLELGRYERVNLNEKNENGSKKR